ncbi:MAG: hypothetical protein QM765_49420 [Myxococcales bacterium]
MKSQGAAKAPEAWFLRAKLASEENEPERAVELLTALAGEAAHRDRAAPLLAQASDAVEKRKAERVALDEAARRAVTVPKAAPAAPAKTEAPFPRHPPGQVVAAWDVWLSLGEERVFVAHGLTPGQRYVFRASGSCRKVRLGYADVRTDVFGIDFRVQFGSEESSRSLVVGQEGALDENKVSFVAGGSEQSIRVFDASSVGRTASCYMTGFSVVAE